MANETSSRSSFLDTLTEKYVREDKTVLVPEHGTCSYSMDLCVCSRHSRHRDAAVLLRCVCCTHLELYVVDAKTQRTKKFELVGMAKIHGKQEVLLSVHRRCSCLFFITRLLNSLLSAVYRSSIG